MNEKELRRQHAQTVKRLLLAESAAKKLIARPLGDATSRVQAVVAKLVAPSRRDVMATVRRHGDVLQGEAAAAVLQARAQARQLGRDQLALDVAPLLAWAAANAAKPPPPIGWTEHADELDRLESARTASSLHSAWTSAMIAGYLGWDDTGRKPLAAALDVEGMLARRVNTRAAMQASSAYSDERSSYWDDVAKKSFGQGDDGTPDADAPDSPDWAPAMFQSWSAVLDRRTCEECAGLDGTTISVDDTFPDDAECPLHENCRCCLVYTFDESEISDSPAPGSFESTSAGYSSVVKGASVRDLIAYF